MGLTGVVFSSSGAEYEVNGRITQTITDLGVSAIQTTNEFTVFVRDCAWLIQTLATDGKGAVWQREVGSTNGMEIYESNVQLQNPPGTKQTRIVSQSFISGNTIPVELLDEGVDGHLWLMFASQCYWSSLNTNTTSLTPVYDWHASVGANPNRKVRAEWELLGGRGSLPREVRYLGQWDETNGLYTVTGTKSVGGILVPNGFIFEERYVGPLAADSFIHEMTLRKRVQAEVTSVQAVCSRKSLLPVRGDVKTVIVDWRVKEASSGNNIPSYIIPNTEKWPSVEEARKIVEAGRIRTKRMQDALGSNPSEHRSKVVLIVMCIFLVGPPLIYFAWQRLKKS
jgi:hypothetical protein